MEIKAVWLLGNRKPEKRRPELSLWQGASLARASCSANGDKNLSHCPGLLARPPPYTGALAFMAGEHTQGWSLRKSKHSLSGENLALSLPRDPGTRGSGAQQNEGTERMSLRSLIS